MKPGLRTTEFWVTAATQVGVLGAAIQGSLSPRYAAIAASVSAVGYALARGLAKSNPPKPS